MPTYTVEGPDKRTYQIEGPEGATLEQLVAVIQEQGPSFRQPPASTERTWGEVPRDIAAQGLAGLGALVQFPGQLYGLATGDFAPTGALGAGLRMRERAEEMKSPGLRAREAQLAERIQEAERARGQFAAGKEAFVGTLTDPALLGGAVIETLPALIPGVGLGVGTARAVTQRALARGVSEEAAKQAGAAAGVAAAKTAAAVQQGADVGAQAYESLYNEFRRQNLSEQEAAERTLNAARAAGASGTIISYLAQSLPGASALERALITGERRALGRAGAAVAGAVRETPSEMVEEGGGRATVNLAMREALPEQPITAGVGEAAGRAGAAALGLGAGVGALQRGPLPPTPPAEPSAEGAPPAAPTPPTPAVPTPAGPVQGELFTEAEAPRAPTPEGLAANKAYYDDLNRQLESLTRQQERLRAETDRTTDPDALGRLRQQSAETAEQISRVAGEMARYAPTIPSVAQEPRIDAEARAEEAVRTGDFQSMRREFDTLQRENQRLRAAYEQAATEEERATLFAEAEKLAPALRTLQESMAKLRPTVPTQAAQRTEAPEGQLGLKFDDRIQIQDLPTFGIPMDGGTPAQRGVRSWLRDNVIGKTPVEVRQLVARDPSLLRGTGLRARVLADIMAQEVAPPAFTETPRAPTPPPPSAPAARPPVSEPPVQGELDLGGTGAGVGISRPPVAAPQPPSGAPTPPPPSGVGGLDTAPRPAGPGVGDEGAPRGALAGAPPPVDVEGQAERKAKEAAEKAEKQRQAREAKAAETARKKQLTRAGKEWEQYADEATQPKWADLTPEQQERWRKAVVDDNRPTIALAEEIAPPKKVVSTAPTEPARPDAVAMSWENNKPEDAPTFSELPDMYQTAYREAIDEKEDLKDAAARITKQVLRSRPSPLLDELRAAKEEIEAEPGINTERLITMLGPKLYGEMKDLPEVSVKELLQNSFDAIKERITSGGLKQGRIKFIFNDNDRTIKIIDNGVGMPPSVMGKEFLTIAGTKKGEGIQASGGFGVAKMLFLYGNKNLVVRSVYNGIASEMATSGTELVKALESKGAKPKIQTNKLEDLPRAELDKFRSIEYGGTEIIVTVPEEYKNESTGEMEPIPFDGNDLTYSSALTKSPLFANVEVSAQAIPKGFTSGYDSTRPIGAYFPIDEYRPFSNVNFKWGTARVYVSKNKTGSYENFNVLSNGIWQFTKTLRVSEETSLPRTFYVDINPAKNVRPEDPGYPFTLNRQDLSSTAKKDFAKIEQYIRVLFGQLSYAESAKDFGTVQYVNAAGKVTVPTNLEPTAPPSDTSFTVIKDTDKVEVKDGVLFVNGRPTPEITEADLKSASIKIDELTVPQSDIDPNKVMIHDNVLYKDTDESFLGRVRSKFGENRVNKYLYSIGEIFQTLRNAVVSANPTDYDKLKDEAVGVSIDTKYYGVNIRIPFKGMFINPSSTRLRDTPAQIGSQLYATMVHELAHFKERSHNANFPAEMQQLITLLETHPSFDAFQIKKELIQIIKDNKDIFDYTAAEFGDGKNANLVPRGNRFKDASYEQVRDEGRARAMESISGAGEQQPTVRQRARQRPAGAGAVGVRAGVPSQTAQKGTAGGVAPPGVPPAAGVPTYAGAFPAGGPSLQMAQDATTFLTKFRTRVADKAATVFEVLSKDFNGAVRNALNKPSLEPIYRQAEASDQLIPAYLRKGSLERDRDTKLWRAATKPGVAPPAEVINIVADWGKRNKLSFEKAWEESGKIMESARQKEFQDLNATMEKGRQFPVSMPAADIQRYYQMYSTDPTFNTVLRKILDDARFDLIDNMVKVGRIPQEMADDWKTATAYIPFDRVDDVEEFFRSGRRLGRGIAQLGKANPQLVDAETVDRQVKNSLDNYFNWLGWGVRQVVQNDATVRTILALRKEGMARPLPGGAAQITSNNKDRVVKTYIRGNEVFFETSSAYHAAAFNLSIAPLPGIFTVLSRISQTLRTAITAIPTFTATQIPQDIQRAIMYSGVKDKAALTARTLSNFAEFSKSAVLGKLPQVEHELGDYGVAGDFDFRKDDAAESFLKSVGAKPRTGGKLGELVQRLSDVARASDFALRRAIYEQTLAEGGDKLLALHRAREIINFRRYGMGDQLGVVHLLTQIIPFYNAYIQGMDVLYRALSGKDAASGLERKAALAEFYKMAGYVTTVAVLYALAKSGDDEYENADLRERDKTWMIDKGFGIPVPSELGILFKALPERILEAMLKQGTPDEAVAGEAVVTWFRAAFDEYAGRGFMPAAIKPAIENLTNYSFLSGRPLEGTYQQQLLPSERSTSRTSELSKEIARFTADTTSIQISPIKIDNFLQGFFGTTASLMLATTDAMINPDKMDRPLHQMVGLSAFGYDPVGTRRAGEFYEVRDKVTQSQNTLNALMKTDLPRAAQFAEKNAETLSVYKMVNSTLKEIERTRAYRNWLNTSDAAQSMTQKERADTLEDIKRYEQQLFEWVRYAKTQIKI